MPLYEFECRTCHQTFEELVRSSDTEGVSCPSCGAPDAQRLMSATARTAGGESSSSGGGGGGCVSRGGFT